MGESAHVHTERCNSTNCYDKYCELIYPDEPLLTEEEWELGEEYPDEYALGPCKCRDYHMADCPTKQPWFTSFASDGDYEDYYDRRDYD